VGRCSTSTSSRASVWEPSPGVAHGLASPLPGPHPADPEVAEEWKWRGTPVWSHNGLIAPPKLEEMTEGLAEGTKASKVASATGKEAGR
jgi:hypothetical protein